MKTLSQVLPGEKITHVGDLTIEGNVGEKATIDVIGSLMIEGSVKAARIEVKALKTAIPKSMIMGAGGTVIHAVGSAIATSGGVARVLFTGMPSFTGSIRLQTTTRDGKVKNITASSQAYIGGVEYYLGKIDVDGRIKTENACVRDYHNDVYEITASKGSSEMVSATIDGVVYRGALIRVEGKVVKVDGQLSTGVSTPRAAERVMDEQLSPPRLCIKGNVDSGTTIRSDVNMFFQDVGDNCVIESLHGGVTATNIGNDTEIHVYGPIQIKNVGERVDLNSSQEGIRAINIGNESSIRVKGGIELQEVGDECVVISKSYGVNASKVGRGSTIKAHDAISLGNIASGSTITSDYYGIKAQHVSES